MRIADLETTARDGVMVARLEGEVDLSNAKEIQSSLVHEMSNTLLGLVIDLTEVVYLDSAGIRAIYELREDLETRGQEIRLVVREDSIVSKALELVGASDVVGIFSSPELASAELSRHDRRDGGT
jgi:stage II sporulation protein AA (anti-sigma F factor antagonist)